MLQAQREKGMDPDNYIWLIEGVEENQVRSAVVATCAEQAARLYAKGLPSITPPFNIRVELTRDKGEGVHYRTGRLLTFRIERSIAHRL
jgi:hypothetical protein